MFKPFQHHVIAYVNRETYQFRDGFDDLVCQSKQAKYSDRSTLDHHMWKLPEDSNVNRSLSTFNKNGITSAERQIIRRDSRHFATGYACLLLS